MDDNMNIKIKYLEMIQNVINRMASNSFRLKELTVTLIAGIFVLLDKRAEFIFCTIVWIPVITFWILDSYYLSRERLYRALYDKVRQMPLESPDDFTMEVSLKIFPDKKNSLRYCFISRTETCYFLPLMLMPMVVCIISKFI